MSTDTPACTVGHLNHVGIAVREIEPVLELYRTLFDSPETQILEDPERGLRAAIIVQGETHIDLGQSHASYNSVPATSGWHYAQPLAPVRWGLHDEVVLDEYRLHNLEHGGVGVHYDCPEGCPELVAQLRRAAGRPEPLRRGLLPAGAARPARRAFRH